MKRANEPSIVQQGTARISYQRRFKSMARRKKPVDSGGPIHCLPEECLAVLAKPLSAGHPIVDPSSLAAERHLLKICRTANAVGFWQDQPLVYPYLSPRPSSAALESLLQGFPEAEKRQCLEATIKADEIASRIAGVAGWLCIEPAYRDGVRQLIQRWDDLPPNERPPFPLSRALRWPNLPEGARPASNAAGRFASELQAFLDRWELMHLATWDLPCPQGPLFPNPLPEGSPAVPAQGIQNIVPVHFPIQRNDDLEHAVTRQQHVLAKDKGIDPSIAGLPHHDAYGQVLQVRHLESIIVQRYTQVRRPKGFMTRIEEAIAAALDCGVDNIQKIRKAISQCLRGKRASVSWLRPSAR
jgi:hypothetical protein